MNRVCILRGDKILTNAIDPEVLGLHKSSLQDIQIKTKEDAIKSFVSVLDNTANRAMTETTILNSAAALIVGNIAKDFEQGIEIAKDTIESGKAFRLLKEFVDKTGNTEKLNEVHES